MNTDKVDDTGFRGRERQRTAIRKKFVNINYLPPPPPRVVLLRIGGGGRLPCCPDLDDCLEAVGLADALVARLWGGCGRGVEPAPVAVWRRCTVPRGRVLPRVFAAGLDFLRPKRNDKRPPEEPRALAFAWDFALRARQRSMALASLISRMP